MQKSSIEKINFLEMMDKENKNEFFGEFKGKRL